MRIGAATKPGLANSVSRRRGLWRLMALIVLLAVIGGYVAPVRTYIERTRQIEEERAVTDSLQVEHDRLLKERDRLNNVVYVEQVARRDLGLVRPGEQPYVVKDLDKGAPEVASVPQSEDVPITERFTEWVSALIN